MFSSVRTTIACVWKMAFGCEWLNFSIMLGAILFRTRWWTSDELTNSYLVKTKWQIEAAKLGSLCSICKKMWRAASWERAEIVCTDLSSCCRASAAQHCVLFLGSALPGAVTLCSMCWEQWGGLRLWAQLSWLCADTWGPRGALSVSPSVSHHVSLLHLRSAVLCGSSHTAGSLQELSGRPPAGRMVAVQAVLTAESKSTCTNFVPAL